MRTRINPIARFAVERRVTMVMAVLGVVVLGYLSLTRLPLEFLPSFSSSSMWVRAPYESASPEEVERLIVRPLEDSLGTINGIETLSASASANQGSVNLTFEDGTDMDLAAVEVRDRIDRVRHLLPDDLRRVEIRRFQSTDIPVFRFHLSADWPRDRLYDFTEQVVQRRLERLEGVAQVEVRGVNRRELQVQLLPARMQGSGVDVREVAAVLRRNHVNVSGGYVKEGSRKLVLRSVGEFQSVEEIRSVPIRPGLRIGDVAKVAYTYPRQDEFNYLNDQEAVTLSVFKSSTANLLAVVDAAKEELDRIRGMPQARGLSLRVLQDASVDVREGLGQLRDAGLLGGLLAVVFLFLFLKKVRTTLLVAISIPVSIVLTFVILYFLRQGGVVDTTLNIISLMGLMLAVGMLVDNSIVVIESISRHFSDLGEDAKTATLRGTSEVAMPIIASTATTMCVFVPMVFLGAAGGGFMRFMTDIGITICIVMVASLLVALTVVPMVASLLLAGESRKTSSLTELLSRSYGYVIAFTLKHRFVFFVGIVAMLYGSFYLLSTIERTFSPRSMARQIEINVDTPRSYSLDETRALYAEVAALLEERKEELEIQDVVYRYSRQGGRTRGGWFGTRKFDVYLIDEAESKRSTREIRDEIRELLPVKAGVEFKIAQSTGHGPGGGGFGVTVEILGDDMDALEIVGDQVVAALESAPWARDVDTSLASGSDEIHVTVRRDRALQSGISTQAVAFSISSALSSRPLAQIATDDREIDMVVQYRDEDRETLQQLRNLPVFTGPAANALPIGAMADFDVERGPRTIERENKRPKITITANTTTSGASFRMMGQVREILAGVSLPPGYEWSFGREARFAEQDFGNALFAFVLALVLIYLIMAALFESFVQPLTIMFSIPFAFIGVGLVLKLTNQPLDNMANMGLIILIGVVVNNAIVLIAHINDLRWQGLPRDEAIVAGGRHRLRPILMTALTTILGLFPMVAPLIVPGLLGSAEGRAGNWAPVGLVILAGLTTSTFLTLVIIPTIYSLVDDCARFLGKAARAA